MIFSRNFRNKKGSNLDMLVIPVIGLVLGIIFIVTYIFVSSVVPAITSQEGMDTTIKTEIEDQVNNRSITLYEGMFILIFIGAYLATFMLAFMIDTHPIAFALSLTMWVISVPIGAILANVFSEVSTSLGEYSIDFVLIPWIFQHYVLVIVVMALPFLFVFYGKTRTSA